MTFVSIALKAGSAPFLQPKIEIDQSSNGVDVTRTLRDHVAHEERSTGSKAVAFRTVLLGVAELAVDVTVGPVTGQNGVEHTMALLAVEARLVPDAATGQHLLGGEDGPSATRTSVPIRRLDGRRVRLAWPHLLRFASISKRLHSSLSNSQHENRIFRVG